LIARDGDEPSIAISSQDLNPAVAFVGFGIVKFPIRPSMPKSVVTIARAINDAVIALAGK
jgi:hypothetical protein